MTGRQCCQDWQNVLPRTLASERSNFNSWANSILSLAYCIAPWNQCLGGGASLSIPMPENASTTIVPPGGL